MGKSRVFTNAAKRSTKVSQSTLAKHPSNPFECLDLEEPVNYTFLKSFPREIRDRIYEYATIGAIHREDTLAGFKVHTTASRELESSIAREKGIASVEGDLHIQAFMSTHPQVSLEIVELMDHQGVPHNVQITLDADTEMKDFSTQPRRVLTIKSRIPLDRILPTAAQSLTIGFWAYYPVGTNPYHGGHAARLFSSNMFLDFSSLVEQCKHVSSLTVFLHDWTNYVRWNGGDSHYHPERSVRAEVQQGFQQVVETLPALRQYSFSFDWLKVYATRPTTSITWDSAEVTRVSLDRADYPYTQYDWHDRRAEYEAQLEELEGRWLGDKPGDHPHSLGFTE